MEAVFIVIFALLGIAIASFLNVCSDRLPRNESLLFPASHCDYCHRRLAIKDNIPIFSYLWLRGRCRYCQALIPRRILWVEIGTGALFGLTYWRYELSSELAIALLYICLFIVILVGAVILFLTRALPFEATAALIIASLVLSRVLTPGEALSGFSNPAVITIGMP